jgi:hypothetical protein
MEAGGAMTDATSAETEAKVRDFLRKAMEPEMFDRFVGSLDSGIVAAVPELGADPVLVEDLHLSTRTQWQAFLGSVAEGPPAAIPREAEVLARSVARRGLDPEVLVRGHQAAHHLTFDFLNDAVESLLDDPRDQRDALVGLWKRANVLLDNSLDLMLRTYTAERTEQVEGSLRRKSATIEALLGAGEVDLDEASLVLGHQLRQWQTALAVWSPEPTRRTRTRLYQVAEAAATALDAPPPVTMLAGDRDIWCWLATPTQPDLDRLTALDPLLREHGLHAAVGIPATGVAGFTTGNEEARAAQALVMRTGEPPELVRYDEVELLCLTSGNEVLLSRMVLREIGPLLGSSENLRMLRLTALTYLRRRMSTEATAAELFVHKNTVRYRISRVEELLGHPLAEKAAQVELALRYARLFNPTGD